MKKYLFFAATTLALASCSSDDYLGNNPGNENGASSAINFAGGTGKTTRAGANFTGNKAAELLGKKFYVLGTKGDFPTESPTTGIVFDNYQVNWAENTAGTTDDNTNDWAYVGVTHPENFNAAGTDPTAQTIKYWDNSAAQYDFIAYSVGANTLVTSGTASTDNVLGTAIKTPTKNNDYKSFEISAASIKDLKECYYTDVTPVEKADYGKVVNLTFKNLTAKVRVAFYETIPGYSVKDLQFYQDETTAKGNLTGEDNKSATLYTTDENKIAQNGKITVTYPVVGSTSKGKQGYNKAFVSVTPGNDDTETKIGFGNVNYVKTTNVLANTAKSASMAGNGAEGTSYYTSVLPAEGHALTLRINYTLVSDDGSNEEIHVYGAKAVVPASYTAWQPNYAYTYIFKISDNTNGLTDPNDPSKEGLFPITFDAVVAADDNADFEHESITTVGTPSVTSYAFNTETKKVIKAYGVNNEYPASANTDIYFSVTEDGKSKNDLNDAKAQLYKIDLTGITNKKSVSEAEVIDALQMVASTSGNTITGRNGIKLTKVTTETSQKTIPTDDGKTITVAENTTAKFTANEAGFYAYTYLNDDTKADSNIYTAVTATGNETAAEGEYYTDYKGQTAVAPGTTLTAGTIYYKKYTNNNNIYGVKVVNIVAGN